MKKRKNNPEFSDEAIIEAASGKAVSLIELQQMFPDISKSRICNRLKSLRNSHHVEKCTVTKVAYYKAT